MNHIRTMTARVARYFAAVAAVVTLVVMGASTPAAALAPQPIDASTQGPLAFVAMTIMIVIFVFTLFYMDRIRSRKDRS